MEKLVSAFGSLRELSDQGIISYPYSTRELVNIVKHLDKFPGDSLSNVLANVYDFDFFSEKSDLKSTFKEVMNKHGIPIGSSSFQVHLAPSVSLPPIIKSHSLSLKRIELPKGVFSSVYDIKWTAQPRPNHFEEFKCDKQESRVNLFSELRSNWSLNEKQQIITDMLVTKSSQNSDIVFISGIKPMNVIQLNTETNKCVTIGLDDYFSTAWQTYFPRVKIFPIDRSNKNVSNSILLHEETMDTLLKIDFVTGDIFKFDRGLKQTSSPFNLAKKVKKAMNRYFVDQNQTFKMISIDQEGEIFLTLKYNSSHLAFVDVKSGLQLDLNLESLNLDQTSNNPKLRVNHATYLGFNSILLAVFDSSAVMNSENLRPKDLAHLVVHFPSNLGRAIFDSATNLEKLNQMFSITQLDKSLFGSGDDFMLSQVQIRNSSSTHNEESSEIFTVRQKKFIFIV